MKRFIFLLVGFVFFSMSGWANHSNSEFDVVSNQWNYAQGQAFIFMENGIEFSVFQDGQFDFFIPNYGPNVSVNFSSANLNFSFNTGYNYNPYVQYDGYGAVIQIQNTPIFYDRYGRVNQIGNVWIDYNYHGLVSRIGGLQIYYRNNVYWRQRGFINRYNRRYVYKPWHRYYAIPAVQYCLISPIPYRQYYKPVRHIYYRPYQNNVRHFNFDRQNPTARHRANRSNRSYTQSPINNRERQIRSNVEKQNREIRRTRNAGVAKSSRTNVKRDVSISRNSTMISETNNRTNRNLTSRNIRTDRVTENDRNDKSNKVYRSRTSHNSKKVDRKPSTRQTSVTNKRSASNRTVNKSSRTKSSSASNNRSRR
ncbi:hypothetical protein [Psychroflexus sp. MBR-150]